MPQIKKKSIPTTMQKVNSAKRTYNKKFKKKDEADEIFSQADINRQTALKKQIKDMSQNSINYKPNFNDRQASIIEGLSYLTLMINSVNKRIKEGELRRFDEQEERQLREQLATYEMHLSNFEKMSDIVCDPIYDKMENAIGLEATAQKLLNEEHITKDNVVKAQESIIAARDSIAKILPTYQDLNKQLSKIGEYPHKEDFEKFFSTAGETAQSIKDGQVGKLIDYNNLSELTKFAMSELATQESSTSEFAKKLQENSEKAEFDAEIEELRAQLKDFNKNDLEANKQMNLR